jgi:hypothetical protein
MELLNKYSFDTELAMEYAQTALAVLAILVVTWVLAKIAKWTFAKLVDNISFLQRDTSGGQSVGASLGKIVSLFIWLFGLMAILNVLKLDSVAGPINSLLDNIVGFVPNLIGAGIMLFVGLMIAGIVRDIATTAMQTVNLDKWANKGGVDNVTGNTAISGTIGTVIYVLIAIPVAIGALDVLGIESISGPATEMLNMIFLAIPNILVAAILLGIGYFISKFVVSILTEVLGGLGVDRALGGSGLLPEGTSASSAIARVAQVAIVLFFAIAATKQLGFPMLNTILAEVLALGGKVVFGGVVIGVGFLIAGMISKLVGGAGGSMAGTIVHWVTIVLFTFMGLSYTGIGSMITETAFSAIVIGMAVAGALAFGLGGREWAGRKLEEWNKSKG